MATKKVIQHMHALENAKRGVRNVDGHGELDARTPVCRHDDSPSVGTDGDTLAKASAASTVAAKVPTQ
jgi:hypothetical protein